MIPHSSYAPESRTRAARKVGACGGQPGGCPGYDNAVAKRFFTTFKKDLAHKRSWHDINECRSEAFEYIEGFYSQRPRQFTL